MLILGIDLGFNQVKACWEGKSVKFPSVIGEPVGEALKDGAVARYEALDDLTVEIDGSIYHVGNKAIRETHNSRLSLQADKTNDISDTVKFLTVLGMIATEAPEPIKETLVITGLPVDEYNELKDVVKKNMEGDFHFSYRNSYPLHAKVNRVVVIPQSAGAYYDYILNADGSINTFSNLVSQKVATVDMGSRTTNIIMMHKGRYISKDSFTVFKGVNNIHQGVRKLIHQKYGIILKPSEMDQIVRQGYVMVNGQPLDISELIYAATFPVVDDIVAEIRIHIPDQRLVDQFVLTGGGTALMGEVLEKQYSGHVTTMEDPEFSNARGYLKYGKFLVRSGK